MEITLKNYEAFFLDYYEGNLNDTQIEELFDFLLLHPNLKEEFDNFEMVILCADEQIVFENKNSLHKNVEPKIELPDSVNNQIIAYFEGDLTQSEEKKLLSIIKEDQNAARDFAIVEKLRFEPQNEIVFPAKASLKKFTIKPAVKRFVYYSAAAAVLTFFVSISVMFFSQTALEQNFTHTDNVDALINYTEKEKPIVDEEILIASKPEKIDFDKEEKNKKTQSYQSLIANFETSNIVKLPSVSIQSIGVDNKPQTIDLRDDFIWFSFVGRKDPTDIDKPQVNITDNLIAAANLPTEYPSLTEIAANALQRNTNINLNNIERNLNNDDENFWLIAGASFNRLSRKAGAPIIINEKDEEENNTTVFALGNIFSISRSN